MDHRLDAETPDGVNRPVWERDAARFEVEGWNDPGELAALMLIADSVRNGATLDLGVGGGRTYPLLRLLSRSYVGIDYTAELVRRCNARYPEADVRLGDARDLSGFPDASFDFVLFSCNGIDAVDHLGRGEILASVSRVTRPGGIFMYSTLNKDGPLFGCTPANAPATSWLPGSLLPRGESLAEETPGDWTAAVRNWRRLRGSITDRGDYGIAPFAAHDFSLLTHFVTLQGAKNEMTESSFETCAVFPCEGSRQVDPDDGTQTLYFNVVARRRPD